MTIAPPSLRLTLLLVALAAAGGLTATLAQGDDPPATASFKTVDGVNQFQLTAGSGTATSADIVTGGTVTFENMSSEMHDVDFSPPAQGGLSCTQTAGGSSSSTLHFPSSPASGSWAGTCTFTKPGTYSFACDVHPHMTGTIVVSDPAAPPGTTTTTTTTTTAPTTTTPAATVPVVGTTTPTATTPSGGGTTTPAASGDTPAAALPGYAASPSSAQAPAKAAKALSVKLVLAQHGTRVHGAISGVRARGRVRIALTARRGDLGLAGKAAVRAAVGSLTASAGSGGALSFAVQLDRAARAALARHHRLAVAVLVTAPAATGATTLRTFTVVLRP